MTPKLLNTLLIISSAVLYYMVISPLYFGAESNFFDQSQNIETLKKRVDDHDKTLAIVPGLIAQAKLNKEQMDSITAEDRKKIFTMVPIAINDIKLMSELTKIGVESGVMIENMGIKDKGNGVYSVSFSVITTYANFKKVMVFWENSMRLFALQSVTFSPGKTEEEEVKFNVELATYYMK